MTGADDLRWGRRRGFRGRLRSGAAMVGTWVKTPAMAVCEVLSFSSLDLLCLDAEHAPFGRGQIDQCIAACRAGGMPVVVRVPTAAATDILNALDCGADGIVAPHIASVEAAQALAAAAYHGPGGRGYTGASRAAGYGALDMAACLDDARRNTSVIAQIEDVEALAAIDAIAAVDGIDCLFIGRADLTVALGAGSVKDAVVLDAVTAVCAAGRRAGRAVGMFLADLDEIPHWRAAGASLFILQSDHGFLRAGANALAARFHQP